MTKLAATTKMASSASLSKAALPSDHATTTAVTPLKSAVMTDAAHTTVASHDVSDLAPSHQLPINQYTNDDVFGGSGPDHLSADGGYDRLVGNGGDDYLFAGDNDGTYRGTGNESGRAVTLDGGDDNDLMQVWASKGAFYFDTGDGQDHVLVSNDATYVKIDNWDSTDAGDTFEFGANFSGKADIWSFDENDILMFNTQNTNVSANGWNPVYNAQSGDTTFSNAQTHGEIVLHGVEADKCDTGVHFGPTENFPLGGWMIYMELSA